MRPMKSALDALDRGILVTFASVFMRILAVLSILGGLVSLVLAVSANDANLPAGEMTGIGIRAVLNLVAAWLGFQIFWLRAGKIGTGASERFPLVPVACTYIRTLGEVWSVSLPLAALGIAVSFLAADRRAFFGAAPTAGLGGPGALSGGLGSDQILLSLLPLGMTPVVVAFVAILLGVILAVVALVSGYVLAEMLEAVVSIANSSEKIRQIDERVATRAAVGAVEPVTASSTAATG